VQRRSVDNVPLVAGLDGMYRMTQYPQDNVLWEFVAIARAPAGSILIIGFRPSGVDAMGLEKLHSFWYVGAPAGLDRLDIRRGRRINVQLTGAPIDEGSPV